MKKIVFVCDGKNFSNEAFQFVQSLYEKERFLLTGAFFHSINYGLVIPNTFDLAILIRRNILSKNLHRE